MMLNPHKADADRSMLLVIDLQTKLLPLIEDAPDILVAAGQLLRGSALFDLPMLATEQYPRGIGPTHDYIARLLKTVGAEVMEKTAFSTCCDEAVKGRLNEIDRPQIIITGIEVHVCVLQSTLDLLSMGCQVFVCADAVGSRRALDYDLALLRMQQAGAVVTTVEAVLFELCNESGTERFKRLLQVIKDPTGGESPPRVNPVD